MRHLYLIGIGTGNPEHMTVQGINALNAADVVFIAEKGDAKSGLADARREICARYLTRPETPVIAYDVPVRQTKDRSYREGVDAWHADIALVYEKMLSEAMTEDGCAALLVWGDPGLYDSTIRILQRVMARGNVALDYSVVPGITSIQALTARHRIPSIWSASRSRSPPGDDWQRAFRNWKAQRSSCLTASRPLPGSTTPMPISIGVPISGARTRSSFPVVFTKWRRRLSRPALRPCPARLDHGYLPAPQGAGFRRLSRPSRACQIVCLKDGMM